MVKKRWGMITAAAVGVILLTTVVSAFMGEEIEKSAGKDLQQMKWREMETEKEVEQGDQKDDLLILVNKEHPIPENYEVELHWLNNGKNAVAEQMYEALRDMLTDGSENGLGFVVASGYRSKEYQQKLLDEDIAASMAKGMTYQEAYDEETKETMPPGFSEHETGLAVDIASVSYQILDKGQEDTKENQWLRENCSTYGFILRYPQDKEEITGISYEPWHFRYVGKEVAVEIMEKGITLEEYLESDISER